MDVTDKVTTLVVKYITGEIIAEERAELEEIQALSPEFKEEFAMVTDPKWLADNLEQYFKSNKEEKWNKIISRLKGA